ncbi:MAG: hypothetical protein LBG60_11045, partial [Bifidobacteriaceae bacterium]|nr:hypothetical protein [Bifidobacteriaceae bacterium]
MAERRTGLGKGLGALIPPVTDFGNDAAAGVEGAGGGSGGRAGQGRGSGGGARRRRPVDLLFNSSDGPAAPDPAGAQAAPAGRAGG